MRCLINRCPNGFTVCCQTCECKDVCHDVCEIKRACQARMSNNPKDLEIAEPKKDKPFTLIISILILCMSTLLLGATGNVLIMQTDTLNAINDTRLEIDDLSEENTQMEEVFQSEGKNVSADEKTPLTTSERELIERVCMAEARGGGIESMMAVAQVISDRSNLWNMTPLEVVTQDSQFAEPYGGEVSAEATQAVWAVFDEGMRAFDSNVTHFHSEEVEPYWTENKTFVGTRGGNRFYGSN